MLRKVSECRFARMRYSDSNRKPKTEALDIPILGLYLTIVLQFVVWHLDYKNYNYQLCETVTNIYYFILLPYCFYFWNRISGLGRSTAITLLIVAFIDIAYYKTDLTALQHGFLIVSALIGNIIYESFKRYFNR